MDYKEYRKRNTVTTPERLIQQSIIEYLNYHGFKVFRINSGQVKQENEDGTERMVKMAPSGTPDIIGCYKKNGRMIMVEVKRPGKVPTPVQEMQMEDWQQAGALVFVATCLEDVIEGIKNI